MNLSLQGFHQRIISGVSSRGFTRFLSRDFIKRFYQGFHLGIIFEVSSKGSSIKGSTRILLRDFTRFFTRWVSARVIVVSLKSYPTPGTWSDDHRNHRQVSPREVETDHQGFSRGVPTRICQKGFIKVLSSRVPLEVVSGFHQEFFHGFY